MDEDIQKGSLTVAEALKMYEEYKAHWEENYREAAIDLKMAAGDQTTHYGLGWDSKYTTPSSSMVIDNELPQYIHQVTNDIRQNVPSIKALPDGDGDIETGEIYSGLFRAIEYRSHADEVCDTAAEYAVTCSIGFMRVDHDYCNDDSDEQEILFKTVSDPLTTWIDPASVEFDGRDANGAITLEILNKKVFERAYPKKSFISFTDPKAQDVRDTIVIAEIFVREFTGAHGKKAVIRRYKFSGEEMLVETTFPGDYIPIVPIYGQVRWIDGKRVLESLIRQARSPQRRLNHMLSKESQLLAQAPIAPIMAVEGTLVNERRQWQIPGLENALEYRQQDLDGNTAPAPTRLNPPAASSGFIEAIASAKEAIKASMGIYSAGLGKREGDSSGIALKQLDHSGDVATFHYPDNVRRSYGHLGEIAIGMMPFIYDTPRIEQTLNDESDVEMVGINGQRVDGQERDYDLTKGKYRVRITTGASYTTRRQEEAAFLSNIAQKDPNFMQIGGDILFKSMDTPGSQALAARYRKIINPQLLEESDQQNPQVLQLTQALQQSQAQNQQMAAELQSKQAKDQADTMKAEADLIKANAEMMKAKTEAMQLVSQPQEQRPSPSVIDPIKEREMDLKEAEFLHKVATTEKPEGEGQDMPVMDDTVEMLQAKLQKKMAEQQMAEQQTQRQAEQEAMKAQQEEQERVDRQQQTMAVIQTLGVIAQQLSQLTAQVAQPKQVVRDSSGAIVGVS